MTAAYIKDAPWQYLHPQRFHATADRMLRPDEVEDAIAHGVSRLVNTPIDQLAAQAAEHRAARGMPPRFANDAAEAAALGDALGIDQADVEEALARSGGDLDLFMSMLSIEPAQMEAAMSQIIDPQTWATIDAIAYGLAKLLNTPLGELKAEADAERAGTVVGSKAGAWANQALDYALNRESPYVATAYMKPPPGHIYDMRSRWTVYEMRTRQALDDWYGSIVGSTDRYHFLAAYDKTSPEWSQGRPVAEAVGDPDAYVGAVPIRDQLQHLDNLVATHETYWVAVAQQNPRSALMREFLRRHWDPWFTGWSETRYQLDRPRSYVDDTGRLREQAGLTPDEVVAKFVREAAQGLTALRETAAYNGIPTPDLGTSQHGFSRVEEPRVAGGFSSLQGERQMNPYVGADGSLPEVAARAIANVHQQTPYPAYGYLRTGYHAAKIYVFNALDDARSWFVTVVNGQQPYEYAAVFDARNLSTPTLQDFGHTVVSGYSPASDAELVNRATDDQFFALYPDRHGRKLDPNDPADRALIPVWQDLHRQTAARAQALSLAGDTYVGQIWPFLLGLPLGGLAGYFLRRWQEQNPGQTLPLVPPGKLPAPQIPPTATPPKTSGDYVGGPWLDIEPMVGGPWLDIEPMVGGPWLDIESAPYVGGPWLDIESAPYVGGPWLDIESSPYVGATYGSSPYEQPYHVVTEAERRRQWPMTRSLIDAAKRETVDYNRSYPAAAWVWSLDPSGPSTVPGTELTGGNTAATPFSSYAQALDYMRSRIQTPHIALAVFDTASPHWPNPVNWTKSDDPAYEPIIAQRVAMSPRMAGDYGGTAVGSAIDDVRERARSLATRRAGNVIGVIHMVKDDTWRSLAFRSEDDADDWLNTATLNPEVYTYAAYFDKQDATWPNPVIEKLGGLETPPVKRPPSQTRRDIVGAPLDATRKHGQQLATSTRGNAAGVVRSVDGLWSAYSFRSLDDAIDWLGAMTGTRERWTYAAAYDKDRDGTAYVQQEEFGGPRQVAQPGTPIPHAPATTSGWRGGWSRRRHGWAA